MEREHKLEFNAFLLSVGKELGGSGFEQLKFLLKDWVPLGKSEALKEPFHYFDELEKRRIITPTDFSILRKSFEKIGRQDLVEMLDGKKDHFYRLFQPKLKDHQKGKFDVVCDGNDSNSSQTSSFRADLGATKAVKLMGNMKDDDLQVQEFRVDSEDGHKESKDIFFPDESANGPHIDPLVASNATLPESRSDEELGAALGSCSVKSSEGPELAQAVHKEPFKSVTYASPVYTPKQHNQADDDDVVSDCIEDEKAESKEPSGNKGEVSSEAQGHQSSPHEYGGARPKHQTLKWPVSSESTLSGPQTQTDQGHGTISSDTASGKQPIEDECSTSSPFGAIYEDGKFDVVCDGNDSNSSQTSSFRADLGATKAVKLMGNMKDDDLQVQEFRVDSEDGYKESKDIFFPDESANGPHIDPLVASNATLPESRSDEELGAALGSCSIKSSEGPELAQAVHKEPFKSVTYASPVYTPKQHNQADDDDVVSDCIEDEKAESKEPSGNKGEVSSEAQGHQSSPHKYGGARPKHQTLKWPVSSESTLSGPQTQTDQGHGTISSDTASGKQPIEDECSTSSPFGAIYEDGQSTQHPTFQDGNFPTTDSSVQPRSYDKGGYSVVISNGTLRDATKERAIVMMKTRTRFQIAIANNNDFDAEVDITFGGMFLGVWLVEAKRSLQNPLIVEGSPWTKGRLTFFSASDTSAPKTKEEYYGGIPEQNGIIELEFKPEEMIPHFYVQHVKNGDNSPKEILMPNFKTATIGDLKREINKKFDSEVALLMVNGRILEEDKTISSYALQDKAIIEVLFTEEELFIESTEGDRKLMLIEPRKTSLLDVKQFIAIKIGIPVDEQRICYRGENLCDSNPPSLLHLFTKAKAPPVFKVSAVVEIPKERKQRGFRASRSTGRTLRGFGGNSSCDSDESMIEFFDSRPRVSLLRGDHDYGSVNRFGEEGRAILCGDEENVFKQFQEDKRQVTFSKEKAVKMVIQLVSNSSSEPTGPRRSSEPTGPKSTRYPPPVPE